MANFKDTMAGYHFQGQIKTEDSVDSPSPMDVDTSSTASQVGDLQDATSNAGSETHQRSTSSMVDDSEDVIVGKDVPTRVVKMKVYKSANFHDLTEKWQLFGELLKIDQTSLKKHKKGLNMDRDQLYEVVSALIEEWVGANGSRAKLSWLKKALKDAGCVEISEFLVACELLEEKSN